MCIVFSIIGRVYWCLRVTSLSMFVDGSSYVSFPRPFIICIHVSYILRVRWVTFLLEALCHCPFHHYIHWWCDFTSCWIWADHHSSSCSLLHHHSRFSFWFIHCVSPLVLFLQQPISRFVSLFASSLYISLSVWFSSLPHYCYHIHIGHPRVHGSWDFLYMLHFIHEGMGFYHWVVGPSFISFLSPYHPSLHYVSCLKTTLRPWDQMSSSIAPTWTGVWDLVNIWMSSCLFFWETLLRCLDLFSTVDLDYWDHTFDDGRFGDIWFYDLSHIWCHTGVCFPFG